MDPSARAGGAGRSLARRGLAGALCLALALSGVRCVQDLFSPPPKAEYSWQPESLPLDTLSIGDTVAPPALRLLVGGKVVAVRFELSVIQGAGVVEVTADNRLAVLAPGDARLRVRPVSTALLSDTLKLDFDLHASVPRLVSTGPDTLYSINDTLQLVASPVTRSGVPITSPVPVTWTLQSGGANVQLLDAASGRIRALGNGDAVLRASSDTATLTRTVYVRQRATTTTSLGSPLTLRAIGQQRQLGTQARDARLNAVVGGSYTWTSREPAVVTVNATGLVQAVAAGSTRVVVTASGPGGAAPTAKDSLTVTVTQARLRAEPGGWDGVASIGTALPTPFVTQLVDAQGNAVQDSGVVVTFEVAFGNGRFGGQPSVDVRTDVNGRAAATLTLGSVLSYDTVRARGTGTAGAPVLFAARPALPARLTYEQQPALAVAGAVISPSVRLAVRDSFGTVVTSAPGFVDIGIEAGTGTAGAQLLGTTSAALQAGQAVFNNLTPDRAGTGYRLLASGREIPYYQQPGSIPPASSAAFSVAAGAPDHLDFTVQPQSTRAGTALAPAIQVAVRDANGNTVSGFVGDVTLVIGTVPTGGSSQLFGTTSQPAVGGVAQFDDLTIGVAASGYRLRASAPGVPSKLSAYFNVLGIPDTLVKVSGDQQNGIVGTVLASPFVVEVRSGTTPVPGDSVIFKVVAGGGSFAGADSVIALTGTGGRATAALTLGVSEGTNTVEARSRSIGSHTQLFSATGVGTGLALEFVTQPGNTTGGAAFSPAVQVRVKDGSGNTVTGTTVNVTLSVTAGTGTAGAQITGSATRSTVSGIATFTGAGVDRAGTAYTLTASATGLTAAASAPFDVAVGPPARLGINAQAAEGGNFAAGAALPLFRVQVQDAGGNGISGATNAISVAITGGTGTAGASLRGTATVNATTGGEASFTDLSIDSAGSGYSLTFSTAGLGTAPSSTWNIVPASAVRLAFRVQPSSVTAGVAISAAVEVAILDSLGNTVTGAGNVVLLGVASGPSGATLSGTTSQSASAGVATFTSLRLRTAGTYTLTASASGLAGATSSSFSVSPAPASRLAFTVQPQDAVSGVVLSPSVQVAIQDSVGNTIAGATNAVSLAIAAGTGTAGATLSGTTQRAAVSGVATFNDLSIATLGTGYRLTATATGLSSATSSTFNIVVAGSDQLVWVVVPGPSHVAGQKIVSFPRVDIRTSTGGATTRTDSVRLRITTGTGKAGARLVGDTVVAAVSGTATFSNVAIDSAATGYTLTAVATGIQSATTPTFDIVPGAARQLAFVVQPTSRTAGNVFSPAIQVAALDSVGNRTTTGGVVLAITSGTGTVGAVLAGTTTQGSTTNGLYAFADLSIATAGVGYTLTAGSMTPGVTGAVSTSFSITASSLVRVVVTPAGATITGAGGTQQFTAQGRDSLGNAVGGLSFTWSSLNTAVATVGASTGLVTAVSSGQAAVAATGGGLTGYALATVAIQGATPVNLWVPMTSGTTQELDAVWGSSPSNVFAAGAGGTILRYDGSSWSAMTSGTTQRLQGLWGTSGSDVFAVGDNGAVLRFNGTAWNAMSSGTTLPLSAVWGTSGNEVLAVTEFGFVRRYNGTSWSQMADIGHPLRGVWGTSGSDVFAVGGYDFYHIFHYNGSTWDTTSVGRSLFSVWGTSPSDVYVAGAFGTLQRYNGSTWSALAAQDNTDAHAIWGTSSSDIYAVGYPGSIKRYNGTNWSTMTTGTTQTLNGVWGTASSVFAVGVGGTILRGVRGATVTVTPGSYTLTALGATAQLSATARDASNSTVSGVTFTWSSNNTAVATVDASSGLVTAVSNGTAAITATAPGGAAGSITVTVNQFPSTITVSPAGVSLASQGGTTTLTATARDANGNTIGAPIISWASLNPNVATVNSSTGVVTAVASGQVTISATSGSATGFALVTVAIPGATPVNLWAPMSSGTALNLRGAWATSGSDIYAVGFGGTILRYNGTGWSTMTSGTTQDLGGVWGTSSSDIYALGNSGTILRYNGASWSAMTTPSNTGLHAISGASSSDIYAVGNGGTVWHFNGTSWSAMTSGTFQDLHGLWGSSSSDIYAVGAAGTILRNNATNWSAMTSGTSQFLPGSWGTSGSDVYAVGDGGTILRYNGTSWSTMTTGTSQFRSVWGTSGSDIYAVGIGGAIVRYNGTNWSTMASGTGYELWGVWGTSSSDVYAFGNNGTILRGVRGATVTVTPGSYTLTALGATAQLTPTAKDASNNTISGFTNSSYTWSSATPSVATVSSSGLVTAAANGTSSVCASAPGGAQGCTTVTVSQVAATITVSPAGASIASQGGTTTLTATARDANGNTISGASIAWASLNPNVATVNSSTRVVSAVASGQVTISATVDGLTGYAVVTVAIPGATAVNLWAPGSSGTTTGLQGLWGSSATNVFAVGWSGTIRRYDGTSWTSMTSQTTQDLMGVWGSSATDVFAVGNGGVIRHYDGGSWTTQTSTTGANFFAVWGTSPRDVFAVGTGGTIVHYNGTSWSQMTSGVSSVSAVRGVWGTASNDVYAVATDGTIVHYDGSTWSAMTSNTSAFLLWIWGTSSADIYATAAPDRGPPSILRFNGSTWSAMMTTSQDLAGVSGTSNSDIYSVGSNGTILRYNGTSWSPMTSGSTSYLTGVWVSPGSRVFTSGFSGTILYGYRGATVAVTPGSSTGLLPTQTVQLTATARDAQNNVISGLSNTSYTWTTSNSAVATVSSSGLVTMQGAGTATITATAPGGAAGTATVSTLP